MAKTTLKEHRNNDSELTEYVLPDGVTVMVTRQAQVRLEEYFRPKVKLDLSRIVAAAFKPSGPQFPDKITVEQEPDEIHVPGDFILVPDQEVEVRVHDGGTAGQYIVQLEREKKNK